MGGILRMGARGGERYHARMAQETTAEPRIVLITAPGVEPAEALARRMVDARLAACVNLLPGVRSIFRWEGEVQAEEEALMVVKTTDARLEELVELVGEVHPYDVPEFVVLDPEAIEHGYREWLIAECADGDAPAP